MVVRRVIRSLLGSGRRQRPSVADSGATLGHGEDAFGVPTDASAWNQHELPERAVMLHIGTRKEVVGESYRQDVLRRIAGPLGFAGPEDGRRLHLARLVPEPLNPRDPDAIRVEIDGELVGYIPAEQTDRYHPFLRWAASEGYGVLSRAHLIGGFALDGGGTAHLGVALNHSSPLMVQYDGVQPNVVDPAPEQWSWSDINVTGEERHQEFLGQRRYHMDVARLAIEDDGRVVVSIDDHEIGRLTAKMSDRYGPALARVIQMDGHASAFCKVREGPNKLECTVKLPAGQELAEWEMGLG